MSITTDLDAIRARWDEVVASTAFGDLASTQLDAALMSASDVPFLLDLVEELRRQVKVWKGKAE